MMKKAAQELIRVPVKHEDTYFDKTYISKALQVQFGKTPEEYEFVFQPPKLTANPNSWGFLFPKQLMVYFGSHHVYFSHIRKYWKSNGN